MSRIERKSALTHADGGAPEVQGEGDYNAARRYRKQVKTFLETHDPEQLARAAGPDDPQEALELEEAERRGRGGPTPEPGDDPTDRSTGREDSPARQR